MLARVVESTVSAEQAVVHRKICNEKLIGLELNIFSDIYSNVQMTVNKFNLITARRLPIVNYLILLDRMDNILTSPYDSRREYFCFVGQKHLLLCLISLCIYTIASIQ